MKALLFDEKGNIVNKLFRKEKEEHLKKDPEKFPLANVGWR